jgi:opacity protein-like surface antigen
MRLATVVAVLLLLAPIPLVSQTAPAATGSESPFSVGGGLSVFNPDIDHGDTEGGALWADYKLMKAPWHLQGIGFEVEARDVLFGHSSSQPSNLAEKTIGGGVTYTWQRFRNFRPYGKAIWEFGDADYKTRLGADYSQSRTVTAFGGGLDYHIAGRFWLRADYEYQFWPDFFKHSTTAGAPLPSGILNPQGITVGVTYHFGHKQLAQ